jgi:HEPN domain-containing protein
MDHRLTPELGAIAITGGDVIAAVIENWQARRRQIAAIAAAAGGVAPPLLPYHTALLDTARAFLQRDECQVAVVIAQTAVEVLVEQIVSEQLSKRSTTPQLQEWIKERGKPFGLTNQSRALYVALTNDEIQKTPFWERYRRHVTRRHDVVHRGDLVDRPMAEESVAVADEIIRHLEQKRGT